MAAGGIAGGTVTGGAAAGGVLAAGGDAPSGKAAGGASLSPADAAGELLSEAAGSGAVGADDISTAGSAGFALAIGVLVSAGSDELPQPSRLTTNTELTWANPRALPRLPRK
jgi:hypothetical protein